MTPVRVTARVTRDGEFWLIYVHELDRRTQARDVAEIEHMARDLVAAVREIEPTDVAVTVDIELARVELVAKYRADGLDKIDAQQAAATSLGEPSVAPTTRCRPLRPSSRSTLLPLRLDVQVDQPASRHEAHGMVIRH